MKMGYCMQTVCKLRQTCCAGQYAVYKPSQQDAQPDQTAVQPCLQWMQWLLVALSTMSQHRQKSRAAIQGQQKHSKLLKQAMPDCYAWFRDHSNKAVSAELDCLRDCLPWKAHLLAEIGE